jgi:hypothetical protein
MMCSDEGEKYYEKNENNALRITVRTGTYILIC